METLEEIWGLHNETEEAVTSTGGGKTVSVRKIPASYLLLFKISQPQQRTGGGMKLKQEVGRKPSGKESAEETKRHSGSSSSSDTRGFLNRGHRADTTTAAPLDASPPSEESRYSVFNAETSDAIAMESAAASIPTPPSHSLEREIDFSNVNEESLFRGGRDTDNGEGEPAQSLEMVEGKMDPTTLLLKDGHEKQAPSTMDKNMDASDRLAEEEKAQGEGGDFAEAEVGKPTFSFGLSLGDLDLASMSGFENDDNGGDDASEVANRSEPLVLSSGNQAWTDVFLGGGRISGIK